MRWLRRILAAVLVLVLALGVFTIFLVRRSFPQINGEITLGGLREPVEVIRDSNGIPHIYAGNAHDLYLAQGYVEAQDRFWQMDFFRHIGSARLAEMFGESQVDADRFLRSLGFSGLAEIDFRTADSMARAALTSYAKGVNAYLEDNAGSEISLEYAVLGLINSDYQIEPWTPLDTLNWARVMSWDLGGNLRSEIARAVLSSHLPIGRVEQLYPGFPADHPPIVSAHQVTLEAAAPPDIPVDAIAALAAAGAGSRSAWDITGGGFEGIGSNNWVIGGDRTRTGLPILANDIHLGIRMPSIWYQVGLHCTRSPADCPSDVVGFTFAGVPGVVVGHNEHIAWGVTNQSVDTQDLYIERINPNNPNQYEVDGEWVDMDVHTEVIGVAGGEDVLHEVRTTRHGPIISGTFVEEDIFDGTAIDPSSEYAVALSWQTLKPSSLATALLRLNNASNYDEFRDAVSLWDIAPQNIVYADREGNIAYQSTGEVPVRANHDGRYPVPGWDSRYEWVGTVPFEEMPRLLNPDQGFVSSANQPVALVGAGPFDSHDAARGYRADRIVELIVERTRHSVGSVQRMQMDARDGGAVNLLPFLINCQGCSGGSEEFQEIVAILGPFDENGLQSNGDSQGAAVYQAVWRHLLRLTFHDELPEDQWPTGGSRWFEVVRTLIDAPDDPWWDDVNTSSRETRDDIIEQAMIEAHVELTDLLGSNPGRWSWGRLHTASFENETLGQSGIAPIEWLFNRSAPARVSGSESLINATGWDPNESYMVNWIPSLRFVVDLSDLANSTAVNTTGNSGHAFHRHYDDMIEAWADGVQHPMRWTEDQVQLDQEGTLTLVPAVG